MRGSCSGRLPGSNDPAKRRGSGDETNAPAGFKEPTGAMFIAGKPESPL